jgi:ferric-dicitrate binding protein FerR (iron transport regulator)
MQYQVFISLLVKRFNGDITAEELAHLNEWLEADQKHRQIEASYQYIWDNAKDLSTKEELNPDVDAAFDKVMLQIKTSTPKPNTVFGFAYGQMARMAAAIAFLLCAVWGYQNLKTPDVVDAVVSAGQLDKKEVILPDGTKVWLRKGSQITYPTTFAKDLRCVALDGEAYFDVTNDTQRHFCVTTKTGERFEVLGTSFNIKQSENGTSLLVKTGKVRFDLDETKNGKVIVAGKVAFHEKASNQITESPVQSFNEIAWQSGHLEFINVPVQQVIADFESYFNIKVQLENQQLLQCEYTSPQVSNDMQQALASFCNTYHLKLINPAPNQYLLKGGTCL